MLETDTTVGERCPCGPTCTAAGRPCRSHAGWLAHLRDWERSLREPAATRRRSRVRVAELRLPPLAPPSPARPWHELPPGAPPGGSAHPARPRPSAVATRWPEDCPCRTSVCCRQRSGRAARQLQRGQLGVRQEGAMGSRERAMVDVRELMRRRLAGERGRRAARACGADRKTMKRYCDVVGLLGTRKRWRASKARQASPRDAGRR
jgi:hypothetical protein